MTDEDKRGLSDSGKRQEFSSGAVRDLQEGKGRYDLLPAYAMQELISRDFYKKDFGDIHYTAFPEQAINLTLQIFREPERAEELALKAAGRMLYFMDVQKNITQGAGKSSDMPTHGIFRVARVFEKGAIKYAPRNWEKGINLCRYLDSALRHMFQVVERKEDEDHPAQSAWNLVTFVETLNWIREGKLAPSLNDLPVKVPIGSGGVAEVMKLSTISVTSGMVPISGKPGSYRMPDGSEVEIVL